MIRLERGDASVSMGAYTSALWLMGRAQALSELADPKFDLGALELDVRKAMKRRAVRDAHSIDKLLRAPDKTKS